ncbi:hypothetical protein PoMZ_09173, partial [Pyricularia oryzae]
WAGKFLFNNNGPIDKFVGTASISKVITAINRFGVFYGDAKARNILKDGQRPIIVNFERATIPDRAPLGSISANAKLKRKYGPFQKRGNDAFAKEFAAIQNVFRGRQ